jgi:hypothetical protein
LAATATLISAADTGCATLNAIAQTAAGAKPEQIRFIVPLLLISRQPK